MSSPNEDPDGRFGTAVAGIGDVNGDGEPDVLVGAGWETVNDSSKAGRAYLFSGDDGSLIQTLESPSPDSGGHFGGAVAGLSDLNGDAVPEVLVGAWRETASDSIEAAGRAYLFSGDDGSLLRTFESPSAESGGRFGGAVAEVRDVNGNGIPDLVVGADGEVGNGLPSAGRVYVYEGANGDLLRTWDKSIEEDAHFGGAVAGIGDADGDGFGDVLAGAAREFRGGQVSLISGSDGDQIHGISSPNSTTGGRFGGAVAEVNDVNGNGAEELLIGAEGENTNFDGAGRAYLFDGADASTLQTFESPNGQVGGRFGAAVAGVGDINEDDTSDVLIGAWGEDIGLDQRAGRAYLFSGADGSLLQTIRSPSVRTDGFYGAAVAGTGDLDRDGTGDVLVGAYGEMVGGRAYTYTSMGLSTPTSLTVTTPSGVPELVWEDPDNENVAKYRIYRDTTSIDSTAGPGSITPIDSTIAGDTSYLDTDVVLGETYFYRVTAVDSAGIESGFSEEAIATPVGGGDCPVAWSLAFSGTDDAGDSQVLTFGQGTAATAGIDQVCGEEELPPKPPSGYDLRFSSSNLDGVNLGNGTRVDLRPSDAPTPAGAESAPALWRIDIQSSSYPVTFSWDHEALADTLAGRVVRLTDAATGGDLLDVNMKQVGTVTIEDSSIAPLEVQLDQGIVSPIPIAEGWNLLSIPFDAADQTFGALLPPCEDGFFFETGAGYEPIGDGDPVPPGEGLFANCSAGTVQITGQAPDSLAIPVAAGWNLVGPFADSVDVESIASDPPGIVLSSFFGYMPDGGYQPAATLLPGAGYWVKTSQGGTLDLSGSGQGAALASEALAAGPSSQRAGTAGESSPVRLRLTDATGREATLHLFRRLPDAKLRRHALPPVPPGGVFDVRFEGGRSAAECSDGPSALRAIETQGLTTPVTVALSGAEGGERVRLVHGTDETRLTAERPSATLASTDDLAVGLQFVPETFALEKMRPNPVSERGTVTYTLPTEAEVTIAVYDVLGRRVTTLVDGTKQEGRHRARLEAGQMPSGTYFVRMRAGDFRQTRRVTVVR